MKKLIALYTKPADEDAFLKHYRGVHIPLVNKIPGLQRVEVTMIGPTMIGAKGNYMMAEMYFKDEAFQAAMASPENQACGADIANFADGLITVMIGDVAQ